MCVFVCARAVKGDTQISISTVDRLYKPITRSVQWKTVIEWISGNFICHGHISPPNPKRKDRKKKTPDIKNKKKSDFFMTTTSPIF